jgi:predicted  nucleic acid-binding Zn-ribbon protein
MVLFGGFALMFYRERLFSRAKTMARHVPGALRVGAWARRTIFRRRPLDYLAELDASAKDVSKRLQQLWDRKDSLAERKRDLIESVSKAEGILKAFARGSAAAAIAEDTLKDLRIDLARTVNRLECLISIIKQIQDGEKEMGNLITLARLRRQVQEADVHGEDTRAIEEARRTLEALREAFARADAALCAVMAEADMNLDLAFQYEAEAVTRGANLQKAAERLETPVPLGVRV